MSQTAQSTFLSASAAIAVLGCLVATVTPIAAGASAAFTGSIVTSGIVGLIFAGQNARLLRSQGQVSLPASVLTTIFGGWFMVAPLLYEVGFLSTAGTQLTGMLVASFGLYMVVAALGPISN